MPTIRDLVAAISRRPGVDAVVVLGRDGLVIDAHAVDGLDAERLAAHLPATVVAGDAFGASAGRGALATVVLEHEGGLAIVAPLAHDAILAVLLRPDAEVAPLLHDLRRNRAQLAALV